MPQEQLKSFEIICMGRPKLSWDVPTQRMSGTQNGTGELQKSLAAGSGKWEIWLHSRWYPRTWGLNLKWKAVTCKVSHQFPMKYPCVWKWDISWIYPISSHFNSDNDDQRIFGYYISRLLATISEAPLQSCPLWWQLHGPSSPCTAT